jgi:hypothetical protein
MQWVNVLGLAADVVGAVVLASGLVVRKTTAIQFGASRWGGDADEELVGCAAAFSA